MVPEGGKGGDEAKTIVARANAVCSSTTNPPGEYHVSCQSSESNSLLSERTRSESEKSKKQQVGQSKNAKKIMDARRVPVDS